MISLNALLGRPVEYYEYPWAIEGRLRSAQSRLPLAVPAERRRLHLLEVDAAERPPLPHRMPHPLFRAGAALLRLLLAGMLPPHSLRAPAWGRKGQPLFHAEEPRFRLPRFFTRLNGKYLIQYRSPIPRLQSNYDLAVARGTVGQSKEAFASFAERETVYFINFYRKWVAEPRLNALAVAYEDLIGSRSGRSPRR